MQDSIFSALFGALSNEHKMNMISNNLANVNTTGFKKDSVTFEDTFLRFAHDSVVDARPHMEADKLWPDAELKTRPRLSEQSTDFTQGGLKLTGNPLDLAIQGEGFFQVRDQNTGDTFLTRNGNFTRNAQGQVIDSNGNQLLAGGGPLELPSSETVRIDAAGNVRVGDRTLGQIDLVRPQDPGALEKVGNNLFRAPEGAEQLQTAQAVVPEGQDTPVVEATINQGYLESSNVEVVTEMVRMIETQRSFEAYSKIMQNTDQIDKRVIQLGSKTT
ncbi:flagellar basal-body rod protein FlgF [Desulfohalovibrio reitneri]|uniref:flagellar basal-body rod protein FlgF n=1 Tax=Desulfohalovibrio reitneri TaxID=1307759 RepID=UPI0004A737C1|nr:flagellar basal-body rod protein FlgF [Desulfohalovibrio reitneri]